MNKINLIGRLTKDLELKYTQGAKSVAVVKSTLAVNRRFKKDGGQEADFINITFFGKTAETANNYLRKGSQVGISGRLQISTYDNQDGNRQYFTEVIVEEMHFVGSKKETQQQAQGQAGQDGFTKVDDDGDLPF